MYRAQSTPVWFHLVNDGLIWHFFGFMNILRSTKFVLVPTILGVFRSIMWNLYTRTNAGQQPRNFPDFVAFNFQRTAAKAGYRNSRYDINVCIMIESRRGLSHRQVSYRLKVVSQPWTNGYYLMVIARDNSMWWGPSFGLLVLPHLARLSRRCRGWPRPCSRRLPARRVVFVFVCRNNWSQVYIRMIYGETQQISMYQS